MKFQLTSKRIEVLSDLFINPAAGWFGLILISPGIFGLSSLSEALKLLTLNFPFGILSLYIAMYLKEKIK